MFRLIRLMVVALIAAPRLGAQAAALSAGAHAVGLATHASPALLGEDYTELYLTQPSLSAHGQYGRMQFMGMVNLEGWTLKRGELNAGVWGEGYVDRRHPHTYLHEAMLTYTHPVFGTAVSLSAGRGFAPFGSDDPMVRWFVKYPSNHHLAQILERWLLIGAVRRGGVIIEGGIFNGDEPASPSDLGRFEQRFGDSWSARATIIPASWLELQTSYAEVSSPEQPFGGGLDHKARHASALLYRSAGPMVLHGLVEVGRMSEHTGGVEFFRFRTVLAEARLGWNTWQVAARYERSDRPEEERLEDLFRSVRPATDNSILGTTRWTSGTLQLARTSTVGAFRVVPFLEISRLHARPNEPFPVFEPEGLYGSDTMWSFSAGIRSTIGLWHTRMGRYGAAAVSESTHTH